MRLIKFRFWNRKVGMQYFTLAEIINSDVDASCIVSSDGYYKVDWTDCELMQFTGLLDKNGKEIYESDIVMACSRGTLAEKEGVFFKHLVVFKQGGFMLKDLREGYDNLSPEPIQFQLVNEVIGNTHQAPATITGHSKNDNK